MSKLREEWKSDLRNVRTPDGRHILDEMGQTEMQSLERFIESLLEKTVAKEDLRETIDVLKYEKKTCQTNTNKLAHRCANATLEVLWMKLTEPKAKREA